MTTRVTEGARLERHEKRKTTRKARENGLSRSAALVSRIWRLRRSRALPSLNLLAVELEVASSINRGIAPF